MKDDLEFVSVIDGRVDINNLRNKQYGIYRGGSQNTYKQFISNTFDDSQISWVATPPNQNTYVSRRMMIRMQFQLNFTGQLRPLCLFQPGRKTKTRRRNLRIEQSSAGYFLAKSS